MAKKLTDYKIYNVYENNNSGMFVCTSTYSVGVEDFPKEFTCSDRLDIATELCERLNKELEGVIICEAPLCGTKHKVETISKLIGYSDGEPLCEECFIPLKIPEGIKLPEVIKENFISLIALKRRFEKDFDWEVIDKLPKYLLSKNNAARFIKQTEFKVVVSTALYDKVSLIVNSYNIETMILDESNT